MGIRGLLLFFLVAFLSFQNVGFSQDPVPKYLLDYEWLSGKDKKTWEKHLDKISEADELMRKSNELYIQAFNAQGDPSLREGKKKAKYKKLEGEALETTRKALNIYRESYSSMMSILDTYASEVTPDHPSLKESQKFKDEADLKYASIGKAKTTEEQKLFSEANEIYLLALEKTIVGIQTPPETKITPSKSFISNEQEVAINQDLYSMYQRYINNEDIPAPVGMQNLIVMESTDMSFEAFSDMWNRYQTDVDSMLEEEKESSSDSSSESKNVTNQTSKDTELYEIADVKEDPAATQLLEEIVSNDNVTTPGVSVEKIAVQNGEYIEFRVQIAASKTPLSITQIQAIYKDSKTITEVKDGSYYRYQIRGFHFIQDAQLVCSNSGVSEAYITSYRNQKPINLANAVKENLNVQKSTDSQLPKDVVVQLCFKLRLFMKQDFFGVKIVQENCLRNDFRFLGLPHIFHTGFFRC